MKNIHQDLLEILRSELVTSVGCTEPAAVALACAHARKYLRDELKELAIIVSRDVFKNGFKVGIPGTGQKGLLIAAALGYLSGDSEAGLEVLHDISPDYLPEAEGLAASGKISIDIDHTYDGLYIKVKAEGDQHSAVVVIEQEHNHIAFIEVDGAVITEQQRDRLSGQNNLHPALDDVNTESVIEFAENVPIEEIEFIYDAALVNAEAAQEGMTHDWGLNIGRTLLSMDDGVVGRSSAGLTNSKIIRAAALAAAASDARMSGCSCPVVINSGSGNQGITASLPILSIALEIGVDKESIIRALVVSHLISLYQKHFSVRISAFCGVVTAAVGAGCGTTYMLGGRLVEIEHTIKTALGGISGMICDGAKASCAMKIALAVQNALISTALALQGKGISPGDGIIAGDAHTTIKNIGRLSIQGMHKTDEVILQIMLDRSG